jgi:hypothetical protein
MRAPPFVPDQAEPHLSADKQRLMQALGKVLDVAMGIRPFAPEWLFGRPSPASVALGWLVIYIPAAAAALWFSAGWPLADGHAKLAGLIAWATLYFAGAIAAARAATAAALDIVRHDILPHATDDYARAVADDILNRAGRKGWQALRWLFAAGAAAVAVWATLLDVAPVHWSAKPFPFDLLLWAVTCFYLSLTAARAVMYATFHQSFASKLDPAIAPLYALDAAETPLVLGLSRLNSRILGFWAVIFLTIVAVLALVLLPDPYDLPDKSTLLFILVPFAGFFSLGFGSFVYLQNESEIRAALRRFTLAAAKPFQRRASELLRQPNGKELGEADAAELERLRGLSERIIAGGRYGSRLLTGFSILLPLILPIVGLIQMLVNSLTRRP